MLFGFVVVFIVALLTAPTFIKLMANKPFITNLLLRFWEPQAGCIRIGGVGIREMDYDYLLGKISVVMQNVILFSDTIANNIKVGNRNATQEEVEEAARQAMI